MQLFRGLLNNKREKLPISQTLSDVIRVRIEFGLIKPEAISNPEVNEVVFWQAIGSVLLRNAGLDYSQTRTHLPRKALLKKAKTLGILIREVASEYQDSNIWDNSSMWLGEASRPYDDVSCQVSTSNFKPSAILMGYIGHNELDYRTWIDFYDAVMSEVIKIPIYELNSNGLTAGVDVSPLK
jgi:hypothetical protein